MPPVDFLVCVVIALLIVKLGGMVLIWKRMDEFKRQFDRIEDAARRR